MICGGGPLLYALGMTSFICKVQLHYPVPIGSRNFRDWTILIALIEIYSPLLSNASRFPNAYIEPDKINELLNTIVIDVFVIFVLLHLRSRLLDWRWTRSSIIDLAGIVSRRGWRLCHFDNWIRDSLAAPFTSMCDRTMIDIRALRHPLPHLFHIQL